MASDDGVTVVYTDGACSGNPGPGGWAWAVPDGAWESGAEGHSTNQRMEITAAFSAVRALDGPLEVRSDSRYVVDCFGQRWWDGWLRRGWVNSKKEPVKNRDLWEPFIELVRARGDVDFTWVKGHSGDRMNDLVDRLAVEAMRRGSGAHGAGAPTAQGSDDATAARGARAATSDAIAGHVVVVTGLRPPGLGGYGDTPQARSVRDTLTRIFAATAELHPDTVVATGLGLGTEQLAAEAAIAAGVPFDAVFAFPDPDRVWPDASRDHFRALVARARAVHTLQPQQPSDRAVAGRALARRDLWLADAASAAVVVWDGDDPNVERQLRRLEERLGDDVRVVDPTEAAAGD
jgi:ribonuclease HI